MRVATLCILMLLLAPIAAAADADRDGISDDTDNCPTVKNADQADANSDGVGDACDQDEDGVEDEMDNCPNTHNFDQSDFNSDGIGDACDPDGDQVLLDADNCPSTPNPDQNDTNADGVGDACDTDDDGIDDTKDLCVGVYDPEQRDLDGDGKGDACDKDRDGDGYRNEDDAFPDDKRYSSDRDNDTIPDEWDQCDGIDDRIDNDHDGVPDGCDPRYKTQRLNDTLAAYESDIAGNAEKDDRTTLQTLRDGPFGNPTYWAALIVLGVLFIALVAVAAFKRNR